MWCKFRYWFFSWLHFSSILEPYNSSRHIYGFDTFSGFESLDNKKDKVEFI